MITDLLDDLLVFRELAALREEIVVQSDRLRGAHEPGLVEASIAAKRAILRAVAAARAALPPDHAHRAVVLHLLHRAENFAHELLRRRAAWQRASVSRTRSSPPGPGIQSAATAGQPRRIRR